MHPAVFLHHSYIISRVFQDQPDSIYRHPHECLFAATLNLLSDEPFPAVLQAKPVRHKLPDGQSITVHPDEARRLGEALLQPSSLDPGFEGPDVAESAVISALAHQEPALRKARGSSPSLSSGA